MRIDFDFSEIRKLADDLAADAAVASGRAEEAVGAATDRLYDRASADAPVATGELRASVHKDSWGLARRVYSTAKQGFFQEYGTSVMPPQAWLMVHSEWAHAQLERELAQAKWGELLGA